MIAVGLTALVLGAGCATNPVLYPNAKLQDSGRPQAQGDIAYCRQMASDYVSSGGATAKEIGKDTVLGGAGGGAIGAVGGAIAGGRAGTGAAIGAATGALAGAMIGTVKSVGPSPAYKNYVDRCLYDKGYDVVGWQ